MKEFKAGMKTSFEMSDHRRIFYFLGVVGVEVVQSEQGFFIHQKKYADGLLIEFVWINVSLQALYLQLEKKLFKADGLPRISGSMYRSLIISLLYLCPTRQDILFSTNYFLRGKIDNS